MSDVLDEANAMFVMVLALCLEIGSMSEVRKFMLNRWDPLSSWLCGPSHGGRYGAQSPQARCARWAVRITRPALRWSAAIGLAGAVAGCATHHLSDAGVRPNSLLTELAREDQASRSGADVMRTDMERIKLVLQELASGRIVSAEDKASAALILDHSPMTFRNDRLVALSPDNYLLAHYLALSAVEMGYGRAKGLVAATIDRYLSMTTGCQKYGTNRFFDPETGKEEWSPIDRATSDEERAKYGIPPLAVLLKQFPEQPTPCRG